MAVPTVFSSGVLVVIATAGMFGLDWRLGLAGAAALPAYGLALRWYLPRSAPLYRQQREAHRSDERREREDGAAYREESGPATGYTQHGQQGPEE